MLWCCECNGLELVRGLRYCHGRWDKFCGIERHLTTHLHNKSNHQIIRFLVYFNRIWATQQRNCILRKDKRTKTFSSKGIKQLDHFDMLIYKEKYTRIQFEILLFCSQMLELFRKPKVQKRALQFNKPVKKIATKNCLQGSLFAQ